MIVFQPVIQINTMAGKLIFGSGKSADEKEKTLDSVARYLAIPTKT